MDNITLNPANKRPHQSLSDFQTGNGTAALDTEWLISYTRITLFDTVSSVKDSDGGVIPVLAVYKSYYRSKILLKSCYVCATIPYSVYNRFSCRLKLALGYTTLDDLTK